MIEEFETHPQKVAQLEITADGAASLLTDPDLGLERSDQQGDTTEISVPFSVSFEVAEAFKNNRFRVSEAVLVLERKESDAEKTSRSAARAVANGNSFSLICREYPDGTGGTKRRCVLVGG